MVLEMNNYSAVFGEGVAVRSPGGTLSSGGLDPVRPDIKSVLASASLNLAATSLPTISTFGGGKMLLSGSYGSASETALQLRNPLAALRLRIEVLAHTSEDPETAGLLEPASAELDRLERHIEDVLSLARAEHRATAGLASRVTGPGDRSCTRPPEPFNVRALLDAEVDRAEPAARRQGVLLTAAGGTDIELDCDLGDVSATCRLPSRRPWWPCWSRRPRSWCRGLPLESSSWIRSP